VIEFAYNEREALISENNSLRQTNVKLEKELNGVCELEDLRQELVKTKQGLVQIETTNEKYKEQI
jgi:hypothetical protein